MCITENQLIRVDFSLSTNIKKCMDSGRCQRSSKGEGGQLKLNI
jgi:hypothetical protein